MILKITQLLQSQVSKFFFMKEANYNHFKIDPKLHNCVMEKHTFNVQDCFVIRNRYFFYN